MSPSNDQIRNALADFAKTGPQPDPALKHAAVSDLRRGRPPRKPPGRMALVERNGILYWEWGPITAGARRPGGPVRRAARRGAPGRKVIFSDEIPALGVNQIGESVA